MVSPGGVTPLTCKGRAPIMLIPSLLAAFIFMLTGMRCDLFKPILWRRSTPDKHDWHPVSVTAGYVTLGVA